MGGLLYAAGGARCPTDEPCEPEQAIVTPPAVVNLSTGRATPLARESESFYSFKGSELTTLKKVWLEPVRGFLSDEFFFMEGLGAAYSRVSSYIFADWNKCGEVMGLAPYGRPNAFPPIMTIENGAISVAEWTAEYNKPWMPEIYEDWEKSPHVQHWRDMAWRIQDDTE